MVCNIWDKMEPNWKIGMVLICLLVSIVNLVLFVVERQKYQLHEEQVDAFTQNIKKHVQEAIVDPRFIDDHDYCGQGEEPDEVLIFSDNFQETSKSMVRYVPESTAYGGGNSEFQMYIYHPKTLSVRDNLMRITPTLTTESYHPEWGSSLPSAQLWAPTCTNNTRHMGFAGCGPFQLDDQQELPCTSASFSTKNSFSFTYGRVEVEAKLPTALWTHPSIFLLPEQNTNGPWPLSGAINIMDSRGNPSGKITQNSNYQTYAVPATNLYGKDMGELGNNYFSSSLSWGSSPSYLCSDLTKSEFHHPNLTSQFCTFGLKWTPDEFYTYLKEPNQDEEHRVMDLGSFWGQTGFYKFATSHGKQDPNGNQWDTLLSPFNQPFYLNMALAVGGLDNKYWDDWEGFKVFAESESPATTFLKHKSQWNPSWHGEDAEFQINSIRVFATKDTTFSYHNGRVQQISF